MTATVYAAQGRDLFVLKKRMLVMGGVIGVATTIAFFVMPKSLVGLFYKFVAPYSLCQ